MDKSNLIDISFDSFLDRHNLTVKIDSNRLKIKHIDSKKTIIRLERSIVFGDWYLDIGPPELVNAVKKYGHKSLQDLLAIIIQTFDIETE